MALDRPFHIAQVASVRPDRVIRTRISSDRAEADAAMVAMREGMMALRQANLGTDSPSNEGSPAGAGTEAVVMGGP